MAKANETMNEEKKVVKKEKVYKFRSQNQFLFIGTNYGSAQFKDGEFETTNPNLARALLRFNDVIPV